MKITQSACLHCKGSFPVQELRNGYCKECFKTQFFPKSKNLLYKDQFEASSPAPFVGRFGYPNINVGIMSVPEIESAWEYDAPRYWANKGYQIKQVVDLRSSLINSRFTANIRKGSAQEKLIDIAKEVGMASSPVDIEIKLKQKPVFRLNLFDTLAPTGPNAPLEHAQITSNPKISSKVEKVVNDDLKATDSLDLLYNKGFDENFLSKLLSVGNLGLKKDQKLVPTRWSITAVDDSICKGLLSSIRQFSETDYSVYFGGYLGNYYLMLFFPNIWSYELFETYVPTKAFATDYESHKGRKTYAENTAGGYYAARLAVAEKLNNIKKQGSVLALRFITDEYTNPLGVWVVREAARKSLASKPIKFASQELMLKYSKEFVLKKFGIDLQKMLLNSKLIKEIKEQKQLKQFF